MSTWYDDIQAAIVSEAYFIAAEDEEEEETRRRDVRKMMDIVMEQVCDEVPAEDIIATNTKAAIASFAMLLDRPETETYLAVSDRICRACLMAFGEMPVSH